MCTVYGRSDGEGENEDGMYADELILCGESEEGLRAMVRRFVAVSRRGLKVNADKKKVIVLNGERGSRGYDAIAACFRI